jgi:hypothetical protein
MVLIVLMVFIGPWYFAWKSEDAFQTEMTNAQRKSWAEFVHYFRALPAEEQKRQREAIVAKKQHLQDLATQCPIIRTACAELEQATWDALERDWFEERERDPKTP